MTFGIVGYGRFGRALEALFEEAGHSVVAFDAHVSAPAGVDAGSLERLAEVSEVIVLAVPIPSLRRTLQALRPSLGEHHLVLDVGSVKVMPSQAMREILGEQVAWVATHPLFGPTSLALGERPLRVVVCPNDQHPASVLRVRALFEGLGCEVLERDAEAHDRVMAETHALAYFVAKGMLDATLDPDADLAPPSSRAIARTVDAVRSDAGHLFATIHRDNPFSAEARRRFLDALEGVDRQLASGAPLDEDESEAPALRIPDLGTRSPELLAVRDLIDDLDRELVHLLARRAVLSRRARLAKQDIGEGVRDSSREASLLGDRRAWAREENLAPEGIEDVFRAILRFSRQLQRDEGE